MKAGGALYVGIVVLSLLASICLASTPHAVLAAHNAVGQASGSPCS
ncbi:hypothetical protein [Roseateles sp. LYH14W]|uniref:Uncharacterized protein n=1 Tax=Pelomonas parva TaxID=3299032 RepID=A0ABW7F4L0_9BURK